MTAFPDSLFENLWLCRESRMYAQLLQSSIFATITDRTTPAQYTVAEQSIRELCERHEARLGLFHYGALTGTHQCIPDVCELASAYLANLRIMQPEPLPPSPPPPPASSPQPLSDEELMANLKAWVEESTRETFFGQDQEEEEAEEQSS
jgi:hypothetical protein